MSMITIRNNKRLFSTNEKMVLVLLFLSFMDFYLYSLHLMLLAFLGYALLFSRVPVAKGVVPTLILSMAFVVFGDISLTSPSAWARALVWPAAFLLGYSLLRLRQPKSADIENSEKKANALITLAAVGFFVHLALNIYINWGSLDSNRNTIDFWLRDNRAATGQAALACVPMAWCVAQLVKEQKPIVKWIAVAMLLAMLYYNLTLGSRTMFYSLLILNVIALIYLFKFVGENKSKVMILLSVIAIATLLVLVYQNDIFNVRTLIGNSTLFERLFSASKSESTVDSRWLYKWEYIKRMAKYPFGGQHIRWETGVSAHDVLLDTYDELGIVAFFAVIALLWDGIAKLYRLLYNKAYSSSTKLIMVYLYCVIFITFVVEPIFKGLPWIFMIYCFLHGMVTGLVNNASTGRVYSSQ